MNTQGTICGVCGRYIEYPTVYSGTLPEKCNGNHMPYPCNPTTFIQICTCGQKCPIHDKTDLGEITTASKK